jgi:hypothetical protein
LKKRDNNNNNNNNNSSSSNSSRSNYRNPVASKIIIILEGQARPSGT